MTVYLTTDEVQAFNEYLIGHNAGLRDFGLLDSAVARPQSSAFGKDAFPTIHEKAAALLHGLARNHAFTDGNKRTAWASAATFYLLNGYTAAYVDTHEVVSITVDAAEDLLDVKAIAAKLESMVVPIPAE